MAISSAPPRQLTGLELMAHLFRRAGFGATPDELDAALERGYEATVEELLNPEQVPDIDEELAGRYYTEYKEPRFHEKAQTHWVYRMLVTRRPLEEKVALFWHYLFATGQAKLNHGPAMTDQIAMFRTHGLGSFRTLLVELSKDPGMIYWLDNNQNTKSVHNENYGRELLELFSMGIGNYTEDDVKNCARAFTGWAIKPTVMSAFPYGRTHWEFEFRADEHDFGEKELLGERGTFNGEDAIDVIVKQPATAHFVARRLYDFFVADDPGEADEPAIAELADVFVRSQYDIRATLRHLFLSDVFRSEDALYAKVKSPVELTVGVARLCGEFTFPRYGIGEVVVACAAMGQDLMNPPSVEGWHTGQEWINTGTLVERINFAATWLGDTSKPGIRRLLERLGARGVLTPEQMVDGCLELLGPLRVADATCESLLTFARAGGPLDLATRGEAAENRVAELLQLIVATREFQLV
jgi:uncharacterized protein (DUF1800 family)